MSAGMVAALLADLIEPPALSSAPPAVANPAKTAKTQQTCPLQPESVVSEGQRIAANPSTRAESAGADSQQFAGRRATYGVAAVQPGSGPSQDSQLSQGYGGAMRPPASAEHEAQSSPNAEMVTFCDRRDRLIRWGWSLSTAGETAARLARRDLTGDERRTCVSVRRTHLELMQSSDNDPVQLTNSWTRWERRTVASAGGTGRN
jgi:hypothetical protein